jgi:hypothetical protein
MKIYIVKYAEKNQGYASVEGTELTVHPEARVAIVYEDGRVVKAVYPLEAISGIAEATKEQRTILTADMPV